MKIASVAVFQPKPIGWKTFFLSAVMLFTLAAPLAASEADSLLGQARSLYYASLKDKNKIAPAIALFQEIGRLEPQLLGRAQTYIGSLTAVKAKYAFWPQQKWKWAKAGLRQMDAGLACSPDDVEALFIHGTTCYYLPKFFGRADDAARHLREIVRLLPKNAHHYAPEIVANVIKFILEKLKLSDEDRQRLLMLNAQLAKK